MRQLLADPGRQQTWFYTGVAGRVAGDEAGTHAGAGKWRRYVVLLPFGKCRGFGRGRDDDQGGAH